MVFIRLRVLRTGAMLVREERSERGGVLPRCWARVRKDPTYFFNVSTELCIESRHEFVR